jgi:hypothetical protein
MREVRHLTLFAVFVLGACWQGVAIAQNGSADNHKLVEQVAAADIGGIGVFVEPCNQGVCVVEVIEGSPASKAGIKAGDILHSVTTYDGDKGTTTIVLGKSPEETGKLLMGPRGTRVEVSVLRDGKEMPINFNLVRAHVELPVLPDAANLHPAFTITPDQFKEWTKLGQEMARKGRKEEDVWSKFAKTPGWSRGKRGRANGKVWSLQFDGGDIVYQSYRSERLYEKSSLPGYLATQGGFSKELQFQVALVSQPKIGRDDTSSILAALAGAVNPTNAAKYAAQVPERVLAEADATEVRAVKFVLSDDKGNNYAAEAEGQESAGTMTFSGVNPTQKTTEVNTNATASANAVGTGGYATATANVYARSVYTQTEYVPYTSDHPYYQARYTVRFPLFDEKGHTRITADVKELTLRIITEKGEMNVIYKLPAARGTK